MEKFLDLFGLYVACSDDQNEAYLELKDTLERKLKEALEQTKRYDHKGLDVGFVFFDNRRAILSCCLNDRELWIGMYNKEERTVQRYIVFDDIRKITNEEIDRFVVVIENIAKNPDRVIDSPNLKEAWEKELKNINESLMDSEPKVQKPSLINKLGKYVEQSKSHVSGDEPSEIDELTK